MLSAASHYLLLAEGGCPGRDSRWRFVLQATDSEQALSASDCEPVADPERAELLAVVRGLEALDEPARVTLVTRSRYVQQGLARGLQEWRENGWQWERFGRIVPVRDHDLWQRVDRALEFHQVDCRCWRFDEAEAGPPALAGPHYLRRRSPAYLSRAAPPDAAARRIPEGSWVRATFRDLCATAARAVAGPLAAS